MPSSLEHDFFIQAFRDEPDLVGEFLRGLGVSIQGRTSAVDAAFSAPVVGYQADAAFLVGGVLVAVEVQLRKDPRKHTSWPIYEATARARHRAACVLVVTPNATVARWAAQPIPLGPSGSVCRPFVLGPAQILADPSLRTRPGVATMASVAHPSDAALAVDAIIACEALPEDQRKLYSNVILRALDDAARHAVEKKLVDLDKWKPLHPLVKKLEKLRATLVDEGRARAVIAVLEARGIPLSAAQRKRILGCRNHATLDRWISRAARAERAQDVFATPPRPRAKRPAPRPRASR
ncbi:MAG TPA: hypothetical protein VLM85_34490 [Polyangiaceae bacterium]|nr:hypothetical protein [Polyangiaceae bacterium]